MDLTALRSLTRKVVGDPNGTIWDASNSTTNVDQAVNWAILNYLTKTGVTYVEVSGTIGTDGLLTLANDYIQVDHVSAPTNLLRIDKLFADRMDPGWRTKTGTLKFWMPFSGRQLRFTPKPTVSTSATVGYIQRPADLVNGADVPDTRIPVPHHEHLAYAASSWLLSQDGEGQDPQKADKLMTMFNSLIGVQ